ncbi:MULTISPECIES: glycosyltransferase [Gordonia]|uniref:glycosyltransferase n=1 Tax=Gordonia TaxID=2053 RepID=UPI0012FD35CA|nr:glycosyltransferase [Gordonia sp. 1D]UOG21055.1 hypothetical protein MTX80_18890 [Gordonia amicalis]
MSADACVVDLNPRSLGAWAVLIMRRLMKRRVVVWGHLHPRQGPASKTARVRSFMRGLADGAILYDYQSVGSALKEHPHQPVWTAPNAIYRRSEIEAAVVGGRNTLIYVGRLVPEKKVEQLVPAFVESELWREGYRLEIIGDGVCAGLIDDQILDAPEGARAAIARLGPVTDADKLKSSYARAVCSVSAGYVGLSCTQSLGFGVPMIYSINEPHAPELELREAGGMYGYEDSSVAGLATAMRRGVEHLSTCDFDARKLLSCIVREHYSAEAMASGIADALAGQVKATDAKFQNVRMFE